MDSPFTTMVLECPMPSKFRLSPLKSFDGLKDPLDHITNFKTTLGFSNPLTRYCAVPSPPLSREQRECGSISYQHHPLTVSSNWEIILYAIPSMENTQKGLQTICSPSGKGEGDLEVMCEAFHQRNPKDR